MQASSPDRSGPVMAPSRAMSVMMTPAAPTPASGGRARWRCRPTPSSPEPGRGRRGRRGRAGSAPVGGVHGGHPRGEGTAGGNRHRRQRHQQRQDEQAATGTVPDPALRALTRATEHPGAHAAGRGGATPRRATTGPTPARLGVYGLTRQPPGVSRPGNGRTFVRGGLPVGRPDGSTRQSPHLSWGTPRTMPLTLTASWQGASPPARRSRSWPPCGTPGRPPRRAGARCRGRSRAAPCAPA
jgi:hypothetical protein